MVRRVVRWMLWGAKGLLLAVAAGAVFLWGWSYGHPDYIKLEHWVVAADRADHTKVYVAWGAGRIGVGLRVEQYTENIDYIRQIETDEGRDRGWRWERVSGLTWWMAQTSSDGRSLGSSYGPVLWDLTTGDVQGATAWNRRVSLPAYLLALAAGAWPVGSLALLVRRRRRARRLLRANRCRHCGYDLRATPNATGPRLATCPECGAAPGVAAG